MTKMLTKKKGKKKGKKAPEGDLVTQFLRAARDGGPAGKKGKKAHAAPDAAPPAASDAGVAAEVAAAVERLSAEADERTPPAPPPEPEPPAQEARALTTPSGAYALVSSPEGEPLIAWLDGSPAVLATGTRWRDLYTWAQEPGQIPTVTTVPGCTVSYPAIEPGYAPARFRAPRGAARPSEVVLADVWDRRVTPGAAVLQAAELLGALDSTRWIALDPFAGAGSLGSVSCDIDPAATGRDERTAAPWEDALAALAAPTAPTEPTKAKKAKKKKKKKKKQKTPPTAAPTPRRAPLLLGHPPDDPAVLAAVVETCGERGVPAILLVCRDRIWDLPTVPGVVVAYCQPAAWATPAARPSTRQSGPAWGWLVVAPDTATATEITAGVARFAHTAVWSFRPLPAAVPA